MTGLAEMNSQKRAHSFANLRCIRRCMYSLRRQLVEKVLLYAFCKFPLLAWAAWQLQYSPTACGTLGEHFKEPFYKLPPKSIVDMVLDVPKIKKRMWGLELTSGLNPAACCRTCACKSLDWADPGPSMTGNASPSFES